MGGCLPSNVYCSRWLQGGHYEDEKEDCGAQRPVSNRLEQGWHIAVCPASLSRCLFLYYPDLKQVKTTGTFVSSLIL